MACAICQTRRPRRFCPGVRGDICSLCCGAEREISVDCPLDCEYLREAHRHEKVLQVSAKDIPNQDISVTDEFLEENRLLLMWMAHSLVEAGRQIPRVVDFDMREALAALIRTYRTLESGLVYESLPANPLAATVARAVQEAIGRWRQEEAKEIGIHRTRDSAVLTMLVFFQHLEIVHNNGRRRGLAFLDHLRQYYPAEFGGAIPETSSLILP